MDDAAPPPGGGEADASAASAAERLQRLLQLYVDTPSRLSDSEWQGYKLMKKVQALAALASALGGTHITLRLPGGDGEVWTCVVPVEPGATVCALMQIDPRIQSPEGGSGGGGAVPDTERRVGQWCWGEGRCGGGRRP
jgi:hypothetical protein